MIASTRIQIHGTTNPSGEYILYWMTAARRPHWNHALEHSIEIAKDHNLPLVVIESLALQHKWANDRISTFVLQGMLDNRDTFAKTGVTYIPYIETKRKEASGLLKAWLQRAKICIIDDYPTYYPKHVLNTALKVKPCEIRVVDSNGFMAMRAQGRAFSTAYSLRRHLHKTIREHMHDFPSARPLEQAVDLPLLSEQIVSEIFDQSETPQTPYEFLWRVSEGGDVGRQALSTLSIDHNVSPVLSKKGGWIEARRRWREFYNERLENYHEKRNHPNEKGASGISPSLKAVGMFPSSTFPTTGVVVAGGAFLNRLKPSLTRSSPGAISGSSTAPWLRTTWNTVPCPNGPRLRSQSMPMTNAPTPTHWKNLKPLQPTTHFGMQPKTSFVRRESFTIIFGCCGERKYSNGPQPPNWPWNG